MDTWKIYRLDHPVTFETRYIGTTRMELAERLRHHLWGTDRCANPGKWEWIQSLATLGLIPAIHQIDLVTGTYKLAQNKERDWIYHYLALGYDLLNIAGIPADRKSFIAFLRQEEIFEPGGGGVDFILA